MTHQVNLPDFSSYYNAPEYERLGNFPGGGVSLGGPPPSSWTEWRIPAFVL